ncbi:MAG: hypothetical protein EBS05_00800 [Proteobacteria bacterium]|nr:hypothetical protein [Pseudomonadota bacterium]
MRAVAQDLRCILTFTVCLLAHYAGGQEKSEFVPQPGQFPPPNVGHYFAGELISVDHVNRRGAIRFVGDGVDDRYHSAPSHRFALLPYGTISHHGAPAELRDIPIGTLLHGYFVLPPADDKSIPPPEKNSRYGVKYTHALSLEDDFSFYLRRGRAWKITSADVKAGKLRIVATGKADADGLKGEQTFEMDRSTRVWKGRAAGELEDLAADQSVQLNFTWAPDWKNGQLQVADVWLDEDSRKLATEQQRQIHIRHQLHRWLAGWVDNVEHQPGGKGIVTVTLFGGMDPTLYERARTAKSAAIAAAEPTLRSWWQEHDNKGGSVVGVKDLPNPPSGSSGLQLRVQLNELLEGFRPGRIVRFRPSGFPNVKLPPEERVKNFDDR